MVESMPPSIPYPLPLQAQGHVGSPSAYLLGLIEQLRQAGAVTDDCAREASDSVFALRDKPEPKPLLVLKDGHVRLTEETAAKGYKLRGYR